MIRTIGRYPAQGNGKGMMKNSESMKVRLYMEKKIGNQEQVAVRKNTERNL